MKVFNHHRKAQSTIEFTFAIVVVMFIIYGMVQMFRWAGMDVAQGRYLQDSSITTPVLSNAENPDADPAVQLNADVDIAQPMSAVYRGGITSGNKAE